MYAEPIYLKVKVDTKWFILDSFRIVDKPEFGGRVIIGTEAHKSNSIIIVGIKAKCVLCKYSLKYDQFIVFKGIEMRKWNGMNWITQKKRLAIYLRDGMACCYCDSSIEDGIVLTLDHLKPHSKNGDNHETNLVTCCRKCNSSRGNRSVRSFCRDVAQYVKKDAKGIETHVRNSARRILPMLEACVMLRRRGSVAKVIERM